MATENPITDTKWLVKLTDFNGRVVSTIGGPTDLDTALVIVNAIYDGGELPFNRALAIIPDNM